MSCCVTARHGLDLRSERSTATARSVGASAAAGIASTPGGATVNCAHRPASSPNSSNLASAPRGNRYDSRAIVAPAARTVLGQHLSCDFLIARFKRSGKLTRLVEIEPA